MIFDLKKLIFVFALILGACNSLPIEKVPLQSPIIPPENARPAPVGFNKIHYAVRTGTPIVSQSPKGILGLITCDAPYGITATGLRGRAFPTDEHKEIFRDTLEGLGYDITGNPGRLFDEKEDIMRTIYAVGGRVTDLKIDTCQRTSLWSIPLGSKGEAEITVEWSVFDALKRKTVYKTTTSGYAEIKTANLDGTVLLFEEALSSSIHNLGTDKNFYNLVFNGIEPPNPPANYKDPYEEPMNVFEPDDLLTLPGQPLSSVTAKGRLDDITKTAVLIQTAGEHGSGFFISKEGHILTNAHVVGNANRVRIVTSGKYKKLIADVIRVARKRDVALLRIRDLPEDFDIPLLPVRKTKPGIGDDVYAIGAPQLTRLQDTVTKGIVSAHRLERKKKQMLIQADVDIHGGNSGGPLIDENGNIIGMAVSGLIFQATSTGIGLNNFIPINDALKKLDISLENSFGTDHADKADTKFKAPLALKP